MPKNSSVAVLKRWMDLDKRLLGHLVVVRRFAERHGVSERTVKRDLDDFREMGQRIEPVRVELDGGTYESHPRYAPGVEPLFTANLPEGALRDFREKALLKQELEAMREELHGIQKRWYIREKEVREEERAKKSLFD